ncbi:MAG TPA: DUF1697 domain-containing protein [Pyrinomonadaceae bacterium]|nr:DUF1697 domain-containing protein [Pyrinomonadaceae bacterium]
MIKYVAFLRGINVGGKKLIKMEDLRRVVESLGLKNVRTFIQSGNVICETSQTNRSALTTKIEKKLLKAFGHEVTVVLQTIDELKDILKRNPFKKIKASDDVMMFVVFLAAEPKGKPKLPLRSLTENLEVLAIRDRAAFILCRRKKNGMFSFPNNFLEKEFGVAATTRNWNTVNRIVALAEAEARS